MRRKNDSMWLLVCLCLPPDTHTPVPPPFQTQRVRLKPDKHTDKPDQSCSTDTHTHTGSFPTCVWLRALSTFLRHKGTLSRQSSHARHTHTHTHSFSSPWQHAELLPLTATVPVSHFTIHTLQPWLREQMGPSGETVNGQSMAENEASYKSHLSPLINAQSTVHRL